MRYLCRIVKGQIVVTVGKKVLRFATEQHPEFWDGDSSDSEPNIKIEDVDVFMKEVVNSINNEREDGSTLLTDMLDAAVKGAIEDGCEGIDHDYKPKHRADCSCDRCSPVSETEVSK